VSVRLIICLSGMGYSVFILTVFGFNIPREKTNAKTLITLFYNNGRVRHSSNCSELDGMELEPRSQRDFPYLCRPFRSPPSLLQNGYRPSFSRGKAAGTWRCTPTLPLPRDCQRVQLHLYNPPPNPPVPWWRITESTLLSQ
jgi:hypothetical protein